MDSAVPCQQNAAEVAFVFSEYAARLVSQKCSLSQHYNRMVADAQVKGELQRGLLLLLAAQGLLQSTSVLSTDLSK